MSGNGQGGALAVRAFGGSSNKVVFYFLSVAIGVLLIALSSKFKVPLWPNPTPVTMQTLVI